MNIVNYYKYAALATAAYVRMGSKSLDGKTFADEAASLDQSGGRLPLSIGRTLFDPNFALPGIVQWQILRRVTRGQSHHYFHERASLT